MGDFVGCDASCSGNRVEDGRTFLSGKKYNLPFMNMHIMLHFNMENVLLMRPDYLCANFGLYSQSVFESKLRDVIVCNTS